VRGIEIPEDHNGLGLAQFFSIGQKSIVIAHLEFQTFVPGLAVGKIDIEEIKSGILQKDQPSFSLKTSVRKPCAYGQGLVAIKTGRTRVPLLDFGRIPHRLIPLRRLVFRGKLIYRCLGLLNAHHIGIRLPEPIPEILFDSRSDPVHIPGIYFHSFLQVWLCFFQEMG